LEPELALERAAVLEQVPARAQALASGDLGLALEALVVARAKGSDLQRFLWVALGWLGFSRSRNRLWHILQAYPKSGV